MCFLFVSIDTITWYYKYKCIFRYNKVSKVVKPTYADSLTMNKVTFFNCPLRGVKSSQAYVGISLILTVVRFLYTSHSCKTLLPAHSRNCHLSVRSLVVLTDV